MNPTTFEGPWEHQVSLSGGVDSGATALKAVESGRPFTLTFADTGNEHEAVHEHVDYLEAKLGVPVQRVRADFSAEIVAKRAYVAEHWPREGIPQAIVDRAVAVLVPTGNPFLDLCIWKTRFPGATTRFCTEELKVKPIFEHVTLPTLRSGRAVISWQGVRADESRARGLLAMRQVINPPSDYDYSDADIVALPNWRIIAYRPLLHWPKRRCFDLYKRHGLKPNRLYALGFGRVGCMLCIMAKKEEVRLASRLAPEHVDRLEEWEVIVSEASKRRCASFFNASDDPIVADGAAMGETPTLAKFGIRAKVRWSMTSRGGRQYDLGILADMTTACDEWGACEAA